MVKLSHLGVGELLLLIVKLENLPGASRRKTVLSKILKVNRIIFLAHSLKLLILKHTMIMMMIMTMVCLWNGCEVATGLSPVARKVENMGRVGSPDCHDRDKDYDGDGDV